MSAVRSVENEIVYDDERDRPQHCLRARDEKLSRREASAVSRRARQTGHGGGQVHFLRHLREEMPVSCPDRDPEAGAVVEVRAFPLYSLRKLCRSLPEEMSAPCLTARTGR